MNSGELEKKMAEYEKKMPGLEQYLKPYSGTTWGMHWNGHVEDAIYMETQVYDPEEIRFLDKPKYQVVISKWNEHSWSEDGGGIQWKEWLSVSYKLAGRDDKIKTKNLDAIVTRHQTNPRLDRRELWGYTSAYGIMIDSSTIEVGWAKEDGKKGPSYTVTLNDV